MKLTFKTPGAAYSIESMAQFLAEPGQANWAEMFFVFYPQLDRKKLLSGTKAQRQRHLTEVVTAEYASQESEMMQKQAFYQAHWNAHEAEIQTAFSEIFSLDLTGQFDDMTANITLNPICPRYLSAHSFDVFSKNSPSGALGMALHEITHFLWFDVWAEVFGEKSPEEYETPHLPWIFSEMAVDPILKGDKRLYALDPYSQHDGNAYECFYTMQIAGVPILQTLGEWYQNMPIREFMKTGFSFCQAHEAEIRAQMI